MENNQSDIADILGKIESGPRLGSHQNRIEAIMRHFHGAGLTLEVSGDERHLNRSRNTMRGYAKRYNLVFPDWTPRHMRPNKGKGKKVNND